MSRQRLLLTCTIALAIPPAGAGARPREVSAETYAVVELSFRGPRQTARDAPARDLEFWARFRHQSGAPEYRVYGFWDGDGRGGTEGDVFKVRFTPTQPGRWTLVEVHASAAELKGQRQGEVILARPSKHRGFWLVDEASAGRRWYRRSDGSHQYLVGNTLYSFLSGYNADGQPTGVPIAADVARNAEYFKKIRFSAIGDRYPHPQEKPFFDEQGNPTAAGDCSHRVNPRWFSQRTDTAVDAAFQHDLIADLILAGPDTEESRSALRARGNGGDPTPYLRYIAARYGSYPNVWICLANEFNLQRSLAYSEGQIGEFGALLRRFLPYASTPVSVHPHSRVYWVLDGTGAWFDHQIIQKKRRTIKEAADDIHLHVWRNPEGKTPRTRPTVNDELSYQGAGDQHSEPDSIEAHLGAFLGGGYGTAGYKPGNKLGHYFWGAFTPEEHTAAPGLRYLRETIDAHIRFWRMAPDVSIFSNLDPGFRGMAWAGEEYVLGTNAAREGIVAELPAGRWTVRRFDLIGRKEATLSRSAAGRFVFSAPASRAVLFLFRKN